MSRDDIAIGIHMFLGLQSLAESKDLDDQRDLDPEDFDTALALATELVNDQNRLFEMLDGDHNEYV